MDRLRKTAFDTVAGIKRLYCIRYRQTVDRLWMKAVDLVTQNQQTVTCDLLTDIRQSKEDSSGRSDSATTDSKL